MGVFPVRESIADLHCTSNGRDVEIRSGTLVPSGFGSMRMVAFLVGKRCLSSSKA